ncbi:MAG: pyridoxamine 5'-phosphate oxidase family protein [Nitrososphaerota archaeon]
MIIVPEMSPSEMLIYLSQPLIAKLATINTDGTPQLSPVWFIFENNQFYISTYEKALKISNIKRDNRVTLLVDSTDGGLKLKGVLVKGVAKVISGEECKKIEKKIYDKYLTNDIIIKDEVARLFKQVALCSPDSVCIEVRPVKITSWDYTKLKPEDIKSV